MKNYQKKIEDNKIIFIDALNNKELIVSHYEEDYAFDTIFIDETYDLDFICYIVSELSKTNDLGVLFSLYDSSILEDVLYSRGLRISNYQYRVKYKKQILQDCYDISNELDEESKQYYLETINRLSKINHEYFNPNIENEEYGEKWFLYDDYDYRIYRKDDKIVGIVDYKIFEDSNEYTTTNKVFDTSNKLCVRCLFGETAIILEDIIKDLQNTYKKEILIHITYTEKELHSIVKALGGIFDYCQYFFIQKK